MQLLGLRFKRSEGGAEGALGDAVTVEMSEIGDVGPSLSGRHHYYVDEVGEGRERGGGGAAEEQGDGREGGEENL